MFCKCVYFVYFFIRGLVYFDRVHKTNVISSNFRVKRESIIVVVEQLSAHAMSWGWTARFMEYRCSSVAELCGSVFSDISTKGNHMHEVLQKCGNKYIMRRCFVWWNSIKMQHSTAIPLFLSFFMN